MDLVASRYNEAVVMKAALAKLSAADAAARTALLAQADRLRRVEEAAFCIEVRPREGRAPRGAREGAGRAERPHARAGA
jgi:hypothetical protein